ncbi:MAG: type II toxin-antitoxin system VapC family toxin [Chloroflexi bacterium]|nr:type II toxin-antitoxin system VapC family toxin [Chloroflexota bacterium]
MRVLLDTNIFLEILLEQEKAENAKLLLIQVDEHEFYLSDYSLHSIGLALFRRKKHEAFRQFVQEMLVDAGIGILSLYAEDMNAVSDASQKSNLDFDDAYQLALAKKHDLKIVSFDSDFDKTERGRLTPAQILNPG